jgi:hypothetical protein
LDYQTWWLRNRTSRALDCWFFVHPHHFSLFCWQHWCNLMIKKDLNSQKAHKRKHFPALTTCLPKVTHFLDHY